MKYIYKAQIINEDNDQIVVQVSSYSEEGLEEEQGKKKWTDAIRHYEEENALELIEEKVANETIEDEADCKASPEDGCECGKHNFFDTLNEGK